MAEKLLINDLPNYAKEATFEKMQLLHEEAITDCLNIVVDDFIVHEITDRQICDKVLHQEMNDDEDDTDEDNRNIDDIPIDMYQPHRRTNLWLRNKKCHN